MDFENRWNAFTPTWGIFSHCTFAVDVTECPLEYPADFEIQKFFWSVKAQIPSLKYQGMLNFMQLGRD